MRRLDEVLRDILAGEPEHIVNSAGGSVCDPPPPRAIEGPGVYPRTRAIDEAVTAATDAQPGRRE